MSRQSKVALAGVFGALIGLAALAVAVWILGRSGGNDGSTGAETDIPAIDTGSTDVTPTEPPPEERTQTIEVGGFPNAVAVGEKGVWVVRDGRRLLRLNPADGSIVGRVGAGDELGSERACGVAVGGGAVWVVTVSGQVARINPETNRVSRLIPVEDAACVAAGARGIWVTSPNLAVVTRIDPATNEIVTEIPVDGFPEGVTTGFGSVWVANSGPPDGVNGTVSRINPQTNAVAVTIDLSNGPQFLATGAGSIWASANDGTVVRIDPKENAPVGRPIPIADGGRTNVTVGGGSVWATVIDADLGSGSVSEIDPETGAVVEPPIPVGEGPLGLAFGVKKLWVTNYQDGSVSAYSP